MRYFAISDIHGCLKELNGLLRFYNPDKEKIILLGDLIDRGENSFGVLERALELKKDYGAIILRGNHEQLLINALDEPEIMMKPYLDNGGDKTIDSFIGSSISRKYMPIKISELILENHNELFSFVKNTDYYYVDDNFIFAHAGVNTELEDWKNTSAFEFMNIRNDFIFGRNTTGKTIIFGHTETRLINSNKNNDVWISSCNTKIGIDGNVAGGGVLNGVILEDGQLIKIYKT